jgi:hypothetical protein
LHLRHAGSLCFGWLLSIRSLSGVSYVIIGTSNFTAVNATTINTNNFAAVNATAINISNFVAVNATAINISNFVAVNTTAVNITVAVVVKVDNPFSSGTIPYSWDIGSASTDSFLCAW